MVERGVSMKSDENMAFVFGVLTGAIVLGLLGFALGASSEHARMQREAVKRDHAYYYTLPSGAAEWRWREKTPGNVIGTKEFPIPEEPVWEPAPEKEGAYTIPKEKLLLLNPEDKE